MKRAVLVMLALLSVVASTFGQGRYRNSLGPATFRVEQTATGERVVFPAGMQLDMAQRWAGQGQNKWGTGPLRDGLAVAIGAAYQFRGARPVVVEVAGNCGGVTVGGGAPAGTTGIAWWPNKQPITVAVVGADTGGSILGLGVSSSLGGIDRLILCGLTIRGPPGSSSAVSVYQGSNTGRLALWECTIEPADPTGWNGHGSKWPIRAHGHLNGVDGPAPPIGTGDGQGGGLEILACSIWPGQEHAYAYVDNVGPSRIVGVRCHPGFDRSKRVERTLIQITNRSNPAGVTAGGPSGYGQVEISDIESVLCGGGPTGSAGGQAITIAGHLGPVWIHDVKLRDYYGGALVVWTDANPLKGVWAFRDGFTTGRVRVENVDFASQQNQNPHVMLGSARSVEFGPFSIAGRGVAIDVDNSYVGPVRCGPVWFSIGGQLSAYAGWQTASKMRRNNVTLTASQLDALALP